jgi:hypothetical protein
MRNRIARSLLTPSMFVALLALVIAAGGTAWAAATIRSADVVNESLTGADIRNNSLTGVDVRNGSLAAADLSVAARASLKGQKGDPGAAGTNGTNGANGLAGSARVVATFTSDNSPSCTIVAARSRNVSSCSRVDLGSVDIDVPASALEGSSPVCSWTHSGPGLNYSYTRQCSVGIVDADTINVRTTHVNENESDLPCDGTLLTPCVEYVDPGTAVTVIVP